MIVKPAAVIITVLQAITLEWFVFLMSISPTLEKSIDAKQLTS